MHSRLSEAERIELENDLVVLGHAVDHSRRQDYDYVTIGFRRAERICNLAQWLIQETRLRDRTEPPSTSAALDSESAAQSSTDQAQREA